MATLNIHSFLARMESFPMQFQPFNLQTVQWKEEIDSFLREPPERVSRIDSRIAAISREESWLRAQALLRFGFVPEKVQAFNYFFSEFLSQWKWIMKDDHFQEPCHRFYCQVLKLSHKSSFSVVDPNELKPAFDDLCEEDKGVIFSWFSSESAFSDASGIFQDMQTEGLQLLKTRLESVYLHDKVSRLLPDQFNNLTHFLEMRARNEGVQIDALDRDWASNHLYDSPSRLFSALSQVFLMKRNETLFALWKELYLVGTGELVSKLLVQCPLLDNLKRGIKLEVNEQIKAELLRRLQYLLRIVSLKSRLEQKYPNWKWIFRDRTDPFSKGFDEKLMQLILSPVPLFAEGMPSKLIFSLESYITIVDDLIRTEGLLEKDAKYLLHIINRQYALHPSPTVVENRESLTQLLKRAKAALRNQRLLPEEGMVRQKPAQYQSIFLLKEEDRVLGKFKPLPQSSVTKEMVGESFNCLLGTDFAPAARGVWLSIRNELLEICFFLETDRLDEAKRKFKLLDKDFRHRIYYNLYNLKKPVDPPHNYGQLAWRGDSAHPVTNEERIAAIHAHLDPKLPLKTVHSKFESGAYVEAMNQFNLLNVDLKNLVYKHLYDIKGPEWAWNGHADPVKYEERREAVKRALAASSFDKFTLTRDPRWFHLQGTLQTWSQNCREGTDLLYKDPLAGEQLRNLPVSLVQMYNILGLIKGAGDCHSGNTLFQFNPNGQIENLIDCDDEFIMPKVNHYHQIQIWTLGLPQGAKPLLRPIVRMLASPEFLDKWLNFKIARDNSSDPKIVAFKDRIQRINQLCREELEKPSITLTCQDLYFELYGGREKFLRLKEEENHRPEFILFQYFMKKDMTQYLNEEAMRGEIFMRNAQDLYS